VDELAKDNQKLFDMIKAYLDTLDVNDRRLRDTRKRNIKNKVSAVAALASLYMTHHDRKWSQWREDLDESPPLTNIHLRYIEQFDRQTQRLISYCKLKPSSVTFLRMLTNLIQGAKRPPSPKRDRVSRGHLSLKRLNAEL
jgi:hypothetical protein